MDSCRECQQTLDQASEVCPHCGARLTAPASGESAGTARKSNAPRTTLILAIVLTILWAVAWFALPWRYSGVKPDSQAHAIDALAAIQEVLTVYQRSEGSFPPSLDTLSDRIRTAEQKAQSAHYTVQYTPGKPGTDGLIKSYALIASSKNSGYLNFYTDQSGIFRVTAEGRPATVQDPLLKGNF
jgi:hypothetical protein